MKRITIRDFRTRPKQVRGDLRGVDEALLTANGQPVALMIPVDEDTLDETLETLRRARGMEALRAIRRSSESRGLTNLSRQEIDELIGKTRRERRAASRA